MDADGLTLADLQPSQFYISESKLRNVESWFCADDLSNFSPIPVKLLDGRPVMTDGHTRAVAAVRAGLSRVPLVWDSDEMDWDMYRRCVAECLRRGIASPFDLAGQLLDEREYDEKWNKWCDAMQAGVERERAAARNAPDSSEHPE